MIKSIQIQGVIPYQGPPQYLNDLGKHNFIYGANATGKTTIAKIIADESAFPNCTITWIGGTKMETMVYNTDFVDIYFEPSSEIPGIFTLGKEDKDIQNKITLARTDLGQLKNDIQGLCQDLGNEDSSNGKRLELVTLENDFKEKCWRLKLNHDEKLFGAFEGLRRNKELFKQRVLKEAQSNNASLESLSDLERNAESVFGADPTTLNDIPVPKYDDLISLESSPILQKKVIGNNDVEIAEMIQRLGNSDWVKQGRRFYDANDGDCPFCQQSTSETFAASLNAYFDEAFEKDVTTIQQLCDDYESGATRLAEAFATILDSPSKFLDADKLKSQKELIEAKLRANLQAIKTKRDEPSRSIKLDTLENALADTKKLIEHASLANQEHNEMVRHRRQAQKVLKDQIWKYLLEIEIKNDLNEYMRKKDGISKAISSLTAQLREKEKVQRAKEADIREMEKGTTNIQPTIDDINTLLSKFGFRSFKLEKAEKDGFYKIVRPDGKDAKKTLSEGEKNFITFLYFYHLIKGSHTETGMTADRVVVFDDPVSSLDSDVLFIVSSLIRSILEEVSGDIGNIKQVFVLTHNVFFHKEVSFRRNNSPKDNTFWIVQKRNEFSEVKYYKINPIKSSYELLWMEVRDSNSQSPTIRNTMRRILENYFKLLGGIDLSHIPSKFDGEDQLICKSLISWLHAGSHIIDDDVHVAGAASLERYREVFRKVFEQTDHIAHYNMMMGESDPNVAS